MSALPQFGNCLEQPRVSPPPAPPPAATWLHIQPTEQRKPPAHTAPFKRIQLQMSDWQVPPDFPLLGFQHAYVTEYRAVVLALDEQIRLLEHPKPPEHAREFQNFQWEGPHREVRRDLALTELERVYVFVDRSGVAAFIERNRIRELLLEAREPLNAAFGEGAVKKLTLVEDDEGFTTLFCLILVPGDMVAARLVLKSFDEHWWLARSGQAGGKLNFDFELI